MDSIYECVPAFKSSPGTAGQEGFFGIVNSTGPAHLFSAPIFLYLKEARNNHQKNNKDLHIN
jgi:hypothetical protein